MWGNGGCHALLDFVHMTRGDLDLPGTGMDVADGAAQVVTVPALWERVCAGKRVMQLHVCRF